MSYQGYVENLCQKGHLTIIDAYDMSSKFCHCNEEFIWSNGVDQTNDSGFPYDAYELIESAKYSTCPTCTNTKETSPARYKIPSTKDIIEFDKRYCIFYNISTNGD